MNSENHENLKCHTIFMDSFGTQMFYTISTKLLLINT